MIYIVEYEHWDLTDLPTELYEYLEWARDFNYYVVVSDSTVVCYNIFTNERDARRYAYTHNKEVYEHQQIRMEDVIQRR